MARQKKAKLVISALFLLFLIAGTAWIMFDARTAPYRPIEGKVFGTFYHIQYQCSQDLSEEILQEMNAVDTTFSTFNARSLVSRINNNQSVETTAIFNHVFDLAQSISQSTDGAFDITVAPLVNLWGFGKKSSASLLSNAPAKSKIDSLMLTVGYQKVKRQGHRVIKQRPETMLDFSAIAKGYACDAVAGVLLRHGVSNYMVEIGGEIRANGVNKEGKVWTVGIVVPTDQSARTSAPSNAEKNASNAQAPASAPNSPTSNAEKKTSNAQAPAESDANRVEATLQMPSVAMATSGNYRNFYYKDGKKYAHTIDPHTGLPVQHSLLSATVIAPTCAEADGYATAFMVMGVEKAIALLRSTPRLKAHLIYSDSHGKMKTWTSPQLEKYMDIAQ